MLNPYASYQMTLLELRHIDNRLEATVEASPEVWEYVDLLMFLIYVGTLEMKDL